jgi:hypothetical protein
MTSSALPAGDRRRASLAPADVPAGSGRRCPPMKRPGDLNLAGPLTFSPPGRLPADELSRRPGTGLLAASQPAGQFLSYGESPSRRRSAPGERARRAPLVGGQSARRESKRSSERWAWTRASSREASCPRPGATRARVREHVRTSDAAGVVVRREGNEGRGGASFAMRVARPAQPHGDPLPASPMRAGGGEPDRRRLHDTPRLSSADTARSPDTSPTTELRGWKNRIGSLAAGSTAAPSTPVRPPSSCLSRCRPNPASRARSTALARARCPR